MGYRANLLNAIYNRIVEDPTILSLFNNNVTLDITGSAPSMDHFPILVMNVTKREAESNDKKWDGLVKEQYLFIDLWTKQSIEDNISFALDVIDRLEKIFSNFIYLDIETRSSCRFYHHDDFEAIVYGPNNIRSNEIRRFAVVFQLRSIDGSLA